MPEGDEGLGHALGPANLGFDEDVSADGHRWRLLEV
jgi:hypothetical protein